MMKAADAPSPPDPVATAAARARFPLDAPPSFRWREAVQISRSVITMGAPATEMAEVGASKPPARAHPWAMPVVIRGGVVGDATSHPAVAAAPMPQPTLASAPQAPVRQPPAQPMPGQAPIDEDEESLALPAPSGPLPGLPVLGRPE